MKLEDQVASLELCKRLKELGVRQESAFYWVSPPLKSLMVSHFIAFASDQNLYHKNEYNTCAFTVAELGRMLPFFIRFYKCVTGWDIEFKNDKNMSHWVSEATEANARAKMLVYLIEQGIVNPKES